MKAIAKAKETDKNLNINQASKLTHTHRSRYYNYTLRRSRTDKDQESYEMIRSVFYLRKEKVGIRQIKMLLLKKYKVLMNLKKIARLKRKYHLITKIRRKNKYSFLARKHHEHKVVSNLVQRKFKVKKPDQIYSTDVTQFNLSTGIKVYLAAMKDLATKEIKSYRLSKTPSTHFTEQVLTEALEKVPEINRNNLIIHSDQGFHFTHMDFRNRIKENGVKQSMSRKGNCLDNAPIESFFGYLKDHVEATTCKTFEELKDKVTKEIEYYNNERPQWDLKKMPPTEYRRHLLSS